MNDNEIQLPDTYESIQSASNDINFPMPSDLQTGCLLRTLVASKPKGQFLELGTGTGLSLSWIVEAMDGASHVVSIDNSELYLSIAKKHFAGYSRVSIINQDANDWIKNNQDKRFDLIFADAWPGKYESLNEALNLLKVGGLYVIDDMLPQPNWPDGHQDNVNKLVSYLDTRTDLRLTRMNWSTGLIVAAKVG